jgi:hypothetical protein
MRPTALKMKGGGVAFEWASPCMGTQLLKLFKVHHVSGDSNASSCSDITDHLRHLNEVEGIYILALDPRKFAPPVCREYVALIVPQISWSDVAVARISRQVPRKMQRVLIPGQDAWSHRVLTQLQIHQLGASKCTTNIAESELRTIASSSDSSWYFMSCTSTVNLVPRNKLNRRHPSSHYLRHSRVVCNQLPEYLAP